MCRVAAPEVDGGRHTTQPARARSVTVVSPPRSRLRGVPAATFSARNTNAMWNANQLAGRDIAAAAPATGQVLKWGGASWYPADDNVAPSPPPASTAAKPSAVYFNQSGMVNMYDPNVNTKPSSA